MFNVFSRSIFEWIFDGIFNGFWTKIAWSCSTRSLLKSELFRSCSAGGVFEGSLPHSGSLLAPFWLPLAPFWLPSGSRWHPFGSLLQPSRNNGSFWCNFRSILHYPKLSNVKLLQTSCFCWHPKPQRTRYRFVLLMMSESTAQKTKCSNTFCTHPQISVWTSSAGTSFYGHVRNLP